MLRSTSSEHCNMGAHKRLKHGFHSSKRKNTEGYIKCELQPLAVTAVGEAELLWDGPSELPAVHDFVDVALCTLRNHRTNGNGRTPIRDQNEQERINQLCYDLYAPLWQFKVLNHFHSHRKTGIFSHVKWELSILEMTWKKPMRRYKTSADWILERKYFEDYSYLCDLEILSVNRHGRRHSYFLSAEIRPSKARNWKTAAHLRSHSWPERPKLEALR